MAITNNHIQLFRNNPVFDNREAATTRLGQFTANTIQDGTPVLARYKDGGVVKTLLALFYVSADKSSLHYNIVGDSEDINSAISALETKLVGGASDDFNTLKKLEDKIKVLNGADTLDGSVAKVVKDAVEALDVTEIKSDGQAIVAVSETDGKVSATAGDIDATHVIQDAATEGNTQAVTVKSAIDTLRNDVKANKVVTGDTSVSVTPTDNGTALKVALANGEHVLSVDGGLKTTISLVEVTENLGTNVAKAYQLQGFDGIKLGKQINIPKDSSLKTVYLGTATDTVDAEGNVTSATSGDFQSLNFVYHLEDGTYQLAAVDVSKFLTESEFKDGLVVADNVVKVKVANDSETFLKVGAAGVKLEGVQAAIDAAKASATTVVTAATDKHISVSESTEADGHKKYTVSDNVNGGNVNLVGYVNTATGNPEATDSVNDAISKLFNLITDGGTNATAIKNELDTAENAIGLGTDGKKVANNGNYTKDAQTIEDEIAALDRQVKANEVNIAKNKVVAGNGIEIASIDAGTGTTVSAKINTESGLAVTADKGIEIASIDAGTY